MEPPPLKFMNLEPFVDPAARDPSTKLPLDGIAFDIFTMPQETLITYGEAAPVLHSFGGVKIVRLSHNLVLKYGRSVLASEGETMKYAATNFPGARLPNVYQCFNIDFPSYFGVKGSLVMDYVDGRCLDSCWDHLSPELQKNIAAQLAAMVQELQSVRLSSPVVIGGGISRGAWFSDYGAGPFITKEGFEKWLNWKLALSKYCNYAAMDVPDINYQDFVLIHGDLSPRNLILDTDNQVWLIDWGCAGVYPAIFEAASLKHQPHFPSFAQLLLPLIYNNANEMAQLEACQYGIHREPLSLPPERRAP
ncbi:phosphotransferase family protein [Mytilinidion resinicola]|uniref:EKC/KEOPS complex subunit BUD32 n=1 Tax=Mytilinidion resinicola TaxID=574789 RepID=A0A6A6Z864_9PEZI|nr:phosphotransferase family protein [Mytilinidion resinicola]KAF2816417.1 phosphotransferase family protein [Mytilinidion resinicola]